MSRRPTEVRGWHVLVMLLVFFGAIIAVNVAFAVMAVRSFPGEDVRRSYLQGLQYNETLAERRAQAALGWRATAALAGSEPNAVVEVDMVGRDGRALAKLTLSGVLQRPTDARLDRALAFEHIASGRFAARISGLQPGRWRLRARAEDASGAALDFESEMTWPQSR